ncbi:Protein takeout [Gryllus bimaculatus]|nr:Protein takeout [Gryllus bimaculatus]
MMSRILSLCVGVAAFTLLLAGDRAGAAPNKLPPTFKLCPRNDPNTVPCLEEAVDGAIKELASGLKDFGIPSLEPLQIPQLGIGDPNSDAPVNLKINFTDIRIYNISNAKTSNVKLDYDTFILSGHERVNFIYAEGNYVMDGRILLIPAKGEGKVSFTLTNLQVDLAMKGEKYAKKDKEFLKITEFPVNIYEPEKIFFNFENLFNGDKTLGSSINNLVNENWKEIWPQLQDPLQQFLSYSFREYARRIFDKVSLDDVFLVKAP